MKVKKEFLLFVFLVLLSVLYLPKLKIGNSKEEGEKHWIQIQIRYPEADVYSVEKEISIPMENILKNIGGYLELESISIAGKSTTYLSFSTFELLKEKKKIIRNLILEKMDLFPRRANRPEITVSYRDALPSFVLQKIKTDRSGEKNLDDAFTNKIQNISGVKYIQKSFHSNQEIVISVNESISQILKLKNSNLINSFSDLDFGLIRWGNGSVTKNLNLEHLEILNFMDVDLPDSGRHKLGSLSTVMARPKEKKEETRVNGEAEELIFVYIDTGLSGFFLESKLNTILEGESNFKLLYSRDANFNAEVIFLIFVSLILDLSVLFTKWRTKWTKILFLYYGFLILCLGFFSIFQISLDLLFMTGFVFLKLVLWLRFFPDNKFKWIGETFNRVIFKTNENHLLPQFVILLVSVLYGIYSFPNLFISNEYTQNQLVGTLEFPPGKVFKETDRITKQVEAEILKRKITEQMIVQSGVDHSRFFFTLNRNKISDDFSNLPTEEGYFHLNLGKENEEDFVVSFFGNNILDLKKKSMVATKKLRLLEGVTDVLQMYKEFVLSQVGTLDSDVLNDLRVNESNFYQNQKISLASPVLNKISFLGKLTDIRFEKRNLESRKFNYFGTNAEGSSIPVSHFIEKKNEEVPDQIKRKNQSRVLEILVQGRGISETSILKSLAELNTDSNISIAVKKRETETRNFNPSELFLCLAVVFGFCVFVYKNQRVQFFSISIGILVTLGIVSKICSLYSFEFCFSLFGISLFLYLEKKKKSAISKDQLGVTLVFLFILLCIPWGNLLFKVLLFFFCFHFILLKFGVFLKRGDQF